MAKTGACIDKLNRETAVKVIKRLTLILKSKYLENMYINFLKDAVDNNVLQTTQKDDQKLIINVLDDISGNSSEVGIKSAQMMLLL